VRKTVNLKTRTPARDKVRETVIPIWNEIKRDWSFASTHIAEAFRKDQGLGIRARGRIVETLYGMIAQARRIDFAFDGAQALPPSQIPLAQYLAYQVLENSLSPEDASRILSGVDWERVAAADERIARENDPVQRLALARSLPDWLAQLLIDEFAEDADALAAALNTRPSLTLRVNTLKGKRDEIQRSLAKDGIASTPAKFATEGLILDAFASIYDLPAFQDGQVEIQDEASQLVAELVAPTTHSLVVDACAGAGGKTLALGALMRNSGRLIALDPSASKLQELRRRASRASLHNIQAIQSKDTDAMRSMHEKADRVLIDVPCSGLGALRHNPEARWRLTLDNLRRFPEQQLTIAQDALKYCKPVAPAIYSTCTVNSAENERVVENLLQNCPEFSLVPIKEIMGKARAELISDPSGTFLKTFPHRHGTDGFFAAVLRRKRK